MKTGDVVLDGQNNRYQVGLLLGRGLWGKTYRVRREHDHGDFVLKCPLNAEDLPGTAEAPRKFQQVCQQVLNEQAELLKKRPYPFLPRLEAHIVQADGEPALLLDYYASSLSQRLQAGAPISEILDILIQTIQDCEQLQDGPGFHGALRPANILLTEKGRVVLSDIWTPSASRNVAWLLRSDRPALSHLPPEIFETTGAPPFSPVADTYALGIMLWRACMDPGDKLPYPRNGLDRSALVDLKDRLHARLKQEQSNPRFHSRLADRMASVVNRAISRKTSPSPPYRFYRHDEMRPRVAELLALVHPSVTSVARIVLDRPPSTNTFTSDEPLRFTVSVGCSSGVEDHEEIACGIAVFDRETGNRVADISSSYEVDRHPSGRFRFKFEVQPLNPGSFSLRVAFTIRDSGNDPVTKETDIEVRAAPGRPLPREAPEPRPLPLQKPQDDDGADTVPMATDPVHRAIDSKVEHVEPAPLSPPAGSGTKPPDPVARKGHNKPASPAVPAGKTSRPPQGPPPGAPTGPSILPGQARGKEPDKPATDSPIIWEDLPLPDTHDRDLAPDDLDEDDALERLKSYSQWARLVELVKSDLYVMMMVGAGFVILLLVIALLVLKN